MHPRDSNGNKIPVCCSFTGCMGCCKQYEKTEINVLGLGISNYFKTLKTLGIIFFIIILINIFLLIVYTNSKKDEKIKDYKDALFRTTIGNIGSGNLFINFRNYFLPKIQSVKF
jgi:hypothetical protein